MIRKRNSRRELGRKRGLASAGAWKPQEPDADTVRMRALHDAKGTVLRHGTTYTASGEQSWEIRRAVHGRINQVELVVGGEVKRCGSLRKANSAARMGVWEHRNHRRNQT